VRDRHGLLKFTPGIVTIVLLALFESALGRPQVTDPVSPFGQCSDDPNLAIGFFHVPPNSDVFMHPRVFRSVPANDSKLDQAPITESGYVLYITKKEMDSVLRTLAADKFSWSILRRPRSLEEKHFQKNHNYPMQTMRITETCPKGSAATEIPVKQMCNMMRAIEGDLRTRRALWEWKRYELAQGCPASGFDPNEYRDHLGRKAPNVK